jgi:hypothetical protein
MGAREWIDKNKNVTTAASVVIVLGAIAFMVYSLRGDRPPTKDWYTVDDGQTWFKDSNRRVPPFEHDGKEAVFAKVYECHGQKFVAYMKRFKPDGKRRMEEAHAAEDAGQPLDQTKLAGVEFQLEYKRPGEKEWTSALDKIAKMMDVKCPHGKQEDPLIVFP